MDASIVGVVSFLLLKKIHQFLYCLGNNKGKSTATKQAAAPPAVTLVDPAVAAHAAAPVVAFAAAPAKAVLVDTGSRVRPEWELAAEEVWKNIKK